MNIHFIAIGGSAMHNLAIALHQKDYNVSGSDDEIFEPSRSRLQNYGLLPEKYGWFPEKIHSNLDAVILGMHARLDNPELIRAKELGIKIFSYPEYLYEQSKDKKRIVIGGSHGKTTITAMIMHVLQKAGLDFDFMVGAKLEGFDVMVKLTKEAPIMLFEGDEYLTSPIDRRPKFHLYHPHIAVISGIAWDHINVFPTFDNYVDQFRIFTDLIKENGTLIYPDNDEETVKLAEKARPDIHKKAYGIPSHRIENGISIIKDHGKEYPLNVFGDHNLLNMNAARFVCEAIGINSEDFFEAIQSFGGAANRLEKIAANTKCTVFKDFAHSPSKLRATLNAVRQQFPDRKLIACMELHTFSSLSGNFLSHYKESMLAADIAAVYFNPHALAHKKLAEITAEDIRQGFDQQNLNVFSNSEELQEFLLDQPKSNTVILLMSSGNYNGMNLQEFARQLLQDENKL